MSIAGIARPEIRALAPYQAAAQVEDTIRLNANEAPWANSLDDYARPLNRYPEMRPEGLRDALAGRFGCEPGQLLVTRGSSEAIDLLIRAFCRAGEDKIIVTPPTFSMYGHYAEIQGAEVLEVDTDPNHDFSFDVDHLLGKCDQNTRLIFLCSPNNPTGNLLPRSTLLEILKQRAGKSAVIVDEAYIEFAGEQSSVELLNQYDNLVVLRTLSKALAFAGVRCGAVIAREDVIAMLNAVQAPYAVSTPVIECVLDALDGRLLYEACEHVADIVSERHRLTEQLAELPIVQRVWPSAANFVLVEFDDAAAVMHQTGADKVLLRNFGRELANCIRISVGTADENNRLLDSLGRVKHG